MSYNPNTYTLKVLMLSIIFSYSWKQSLQKHSSSCIRKCGNTNIRYPFGIGASNCYLNSSFSVECDTSSSPNRAYLKHLNLEIKEIIPYDSISRGGFLIVKFPTTSSIGGVCGSNNNNTKNETWVSHNLTKSIFYFADSEHRYDDYTNNVFVSVGCENGYGLMYDKKGEIITGCTSVCKPAASPRPSRCYGYQCCQTNFETTSHLREYSIKVINTETNGSCSFRSAFLISRKYFEDGIPLAASGAGKITSVPVVLKWGDTHGFVIDTGFNFGFVGVGASLGRNPIHPIEEDDTSLVEYFISSMNESSLIKIVDPIVLKDGKEDDIIKFSNIAKLCLNPIRQERPTMKEVTMGLEGLRKLRSLSMNKISKAPTRLHDQTSEYWGVGSSSNTISEIGNAYSFRAITFDNIDLNNTSCSKEVEIQLFHTN
ncbi:unnamed protein product [Amaranthus hypochondriacus]